MRFELRCAHAHPDVGGDDEGERGNAEDLHLHEAEKSRSETQRETRADERPAPTGQHAGTIIRPE